ncbi:SfiI-subtelomeric fragment related protein family member, putative [Theileria annulata]|uniref:SfiI-subtelomeric related protein family member, putative n=1 Tax=Theileria annulata TaxID=5874 RepID=Q4UJ13_THEAN|nr:SfiI-subtelomeric fragment related protein family member, putative [Theileria annulata]CAI72926.1 SfiI-subtelomeric fragment related protein family member, putative [Theileria annulata]
MDYLKASHNQNNRMVRFPFKLIELDITTGQATPSYSDTPTHTAPHNYYEIGKPYGYKLGDHGSYTCEEGFAIAKLMRGRNLILRAVTSSDYMKRVFISCSAIDYIVIQLFNGNFKIIRNRKDGLGWVKITYKLPDLTKLKLLDESGNEVTEPEFSYGLISTDFIITFNFKCSEIKYDTHTVWKLEDSQEFPEALTISLKYQSILLLFKNDKKTEIVMRHFINNFKWLSPADVDGNIERSITQITYNGDLHKIYEANSNYCIRSFKLNNEIVWKAKDTSEYASAIISSVCYNMNRSILIIRYDKFTLLSKSHGNDWEDVTLNSFDFYQLKFFDENNNKLSIFQCTAEFFGLKLCITFDFNCDHITYKEEKFWERESCGEYPLKLCIDLTTNSVCFFYRSTKIDSYSFKISGPKFLEHKPMTIIDLIEQIRHLTQELTTSKMPIKLFSESINKTIEGFELFNNESEEKMKKFNSLLGLNPNARLDEQLFALMHALSESSIFYRPYINYHMGQTSEELTYILSGKL